MAHRVFPTENSIGTFRGVDCRILRELPLTSWLHYRGSSTLSKFVYTGLVVTHDSGLDIDISAGTAVIDGYVCQTSGSENQPGLANNTTNYVYLRMYRTSDLVTTFDFVTNTTGINIDDAVLIARVKTAGGTVTLIQNAVNNGTSWGSYTGSGSTDTIFLGWKPKFVIITSDDSDGLKIFHTSGLAKGTDSDVLGLSITKSGVDPSVVSISTSIEILDYGFYVTGNYINHSGDSYRYLAIY